MLYSPFHPTQSTHPPTHPEGSCAPCPLACHLPALHRAAKLMPYICDTHYVTSHLHSQFMQHVLPKLGLLFRDTSMLPDDHRPVSYLDPSGTCMCFYGNMDALLICNTTAGFPGKEQVIFALISLVPNAMPKASGLHEFAYCAGESLGEVQGFERYFSGPSLRWQTLPHPLR